MAAELRYGAAKKGSPRLTAQVEAILGVMDAVACEKSMDVAYGTLRSALEMAGQPIGANDLLIATQAITLGLTVVTANIREFERIEGLHVENWL